MLIRMQLFWRRDGVERQYGQILTDSQADLESMPRRQHPRPVLVESKEISYHLNARHAKPVKREAERAVMPPAESAVLETPEEEYLADVSKRPKEKRGLKELKELWQTYHPDDPMPRENKPFFANWAYEAGL